MTAEITMPHGLTVIRTDKGFRAFGIAPEFERRITWVAQGYWVYQGGHAPKLSQVIEQLDRDYGALKLRYEQDEARKAAELGAWQDIHDAAWEEVVDQFGGQQDN